MTGLQILASGSSGNCALISSGRGRLLIDCGISMRRICTAVKNDGGSPELLAGILLTHAHSDHTAGLKMMEKYYRLPIYCTRECADEAMRWIPGIAEHINAVTPGEDFILSGYTVCAFPTSHDSPGSVGWRISDGESSMALATDLGYISGAVLDGVSGVDTAIIETNHDINMLKCGPYPYDLKRRILSSTGHLCNEEGARLAAHAVKNGASRIILAHLSEENNLPSLAKKAVADCFAREGIDAEVIVALRSEPSEKVYL